MITAGAHFYNLQDSGDLFGVEFFRRFYEEEDEASFKKRFYGDGNREIFGVGCER